MAHTILYRTLPGGGTDEFINNFLTSAEKDPFGTVIILPTARLAREIRQKLETEGHTIIPDNITTVSAFAESVFDSHAASKTIISDAEASVILSSILSSHPDEFSLFTGNGNPARQVNDLRILISVFVQRNVSYPECLRSLQSEKSSQIRGIYDAYLGFLRENNLVDRYTVIKWSEEYLKKRTGEIRTVWIYGLFEPVSSEQAFILALKNHVQEMYYAIPYAKNSSVFTDNGGWLEADEIIDLSSEDQTEDEYETQENFLRSGRFFSGNTGADIYTSAQHKRKNTGKSAEITVASCKDRMDEIREIAQKCRSLTDTGIYPGDIAVVFPEVASSTPLVAEVFPDFGIEFSSSTGLQFAQSPLIQAAFSILAVPVFRYRRDDVVTLLSSPYFSYWCEKDGKPLSYDGSDIDLLSREAGVVDGKNNWNTRLSALVARIENEASTDEAGADNLRDRIAHIKNVQDYLTGIFAELESIERAETIHEFVNVFRRLADPFGLMRPLKEGNPDILRNEAEECMLLCRLFDDLEASARLIPSEKITPSGFYSLFSRMVKGRRKDPKTDAGAIQVMGIRELQHLSYPYVFIAGLVEGEMPKLASRLPFTNDREVSAMGTLSGRDILQSERYYFLSALISGEKNVYLSYPQSDGDKTLLSSGFVEDLNESGIAGEWGCGIFSHSKRSAEIETGKLISMGRPAEEERNCAATAARINIENYHRRGGYDSPYDGLLTGNEEIRALLAEKEGPERVYSPTALENYASCPFRYLLKNVLYIGILPETELELSALERGSLIHEILFRFFSEMPENAGKIRKQDHERSLKQILEIAKDAMLRYERDDPVWEVFKEEMLGETGKGEGILERFLRHEEEHEDSAFTPALFEYSFGLKGRKKRSDIHSEEDAVSIPSDTESGEVLRLRGSIDRVDLADGEKFMVTDYKTGKHPTLADIKEGYALQLPLYLRAMEVLTGMRGVAGSYYTVGGKEVINKAEIWDKNEKESFSTYKTARLGKDDDFREILNNSLAYAGTYIKGIRDGRFTLSEDKKRCPAYCEYTRICRFSELRLFEADEEVDTDE